MVGSIYVELHLTLLHTIYTRFGFCGFREEDFFHVFPIISLWQIMTSSERVLYGLHGHGFSAL